MDGEAATTGYVRSVPSIPTGAAGTHLGIAGGSAAFSPFPRTGTPPNEPRILGEVAGLLLFK